MSQYVFGAAIPSPIFYEMDYYSVWTVVSEVNILRYATGGSTYYTGIL